MTVRAVSAATSELAVVTHRGERRHNTDAVAHFQSPSSGRLAFAVAAGTSDSPAAAWTASIAADHAVRSAVDSVDAAAAVLSAHEIVTYGSPVGDASLAVALSPRPGTVGDHWTIGWAGDCRVYAWDGDQLEQLTTDHTVAQTRRSRSPVAAEDRVLTTSVRRVAAGEVGLVTVARPRWLVLVTAPVRRLLARERLERLLERGAGARDKAELLWRALCDLEPTDNATASIIRCDDRPDRRPRPVAATDQDVPEHASRLGPAPGLVASS